MDSGWIPNLSFNVLLSEDVAMSIKSLVAIIGVEVGEVGCLLMFRDQDRAQDLEADWLRQFEKGSHGANGEKVWF
jgi:hypothetical protein